MALLSPPPKMQFFGDDGLPLSGGLVHTYSKDTTTPLATYTDSTGSMANSNPVALDSQGRANIWLQIIPYSFVIYNSLGILQSCSGPIEFPPAAVSGSDIAAWSDIVVYDYPDLVAGTDGFTYRCVGTNILNDDPVGSVTGAWVNLSSIASVNLTGTPTAPTAAAGTNTTQIATCAFVQSAIVENTFFDIIGGDATASGHILTFEPCECWNSTRTTLLETTANKTVTLPSVASTWYYVFLVKLVSDGSFEFRAYATKAAVASDTQVSAYRYITPWITNSATNAASAILKAGELWFDTYADTPIASAINPTNWTLLDLSSVGFPIADFSHIIAPPANTADTEYIAYASVAAPGNIGVVMRGGGVGGWGAGNQCPMIFVPVNGNGVYIKEVGSSGTSNYALLAIRLKR